MLHRANDIKVNIIVINVNLTKYAYDQRQQDSDISSSIMLKKNSKICNTNISKTPVAWNYIERNGIL